MKKILSFMLVFSIIFCSASYVFAADEYTFDLQYTGTVVKNVEKDAKVLLVGVNGTTYTNVQIKVDISGPATPKLLATDSSGIEYDIAQLGYWGPSSGFAVQGDFTNTTPIKATFTEAGKYTITLSLINLANNNSIITSKVFTIDVLNEETPPTTNNTVSNNITAVNNVTNNNSIGELPKTGTSIGEYLVYFFIIGTIFLVSYIFLNKKRYNY